MLTNFQPDQPGTPQSGTGAFVRLGWMAFGFIAMVIGAMSLASHPTWTLGWRDAAFWGAALVTAACRYIDISRFDGETADGNPATTRDLRRYLIGLALASSAVWMLVQSVDL